jgi:hypothetical protein
MLGKSWRRRSSCKVEIGISLAKIVINKYRFVCMLRCACDERFYFVFQLPQQLAIWGLSRKVNARRPLLCRRCRPTPKDTFALFIDENYAPATEQGLDSTRDGLWLSRLGPTHELGKEVSPFLLLLRSLERSG